MTMTGISSTGGIETPFRPGTDDPAAEFTEEQARKWLGSNRTTSVRLLAKVWNWHPSRVHRFVTRVRGETVRETPAVSGETPETPGDDFDWKRAEVILPARTALYAYLDPESGDLRIHASDAAEQCDTELRINAEDVRDFISGLVALVRDHGGAR
jgi:hypothetical protein